MGRTLWLRGCLDIQESYLCADQSVSGYALRMGSSRAMFMVSRTATQHTLSLLCFFPSYKITAGWRVST
jgi:hypothetical protein